MEMFVEITYSIGTDRRPSRLVFKDLPHPWNIDATVDDCMRDVDAFWSKLARYALAQGPHRELASSEGRHLR